MTRVEVSASAVRVMRGGHTVQEATIPADGQWRLCPDSGWQPCDQLGEACGCLVIEVEGGRARVIRAPVLSEIYPMADYTQAQVTDWVAGLSEQELRDTLARVVYLLRDQLR